MREQVLARQTIGEYRYEVFYDSFDSIEHIEFENEQDKQDYLHKFETGELTSFGVVKSKVCECCCLWSEVDSIWSMHFETAEEALSDYLSFHEAMRA